MQIVNTINVEVRAINYNHDIGYRICLMTCTDIHISIMQTCHVSEI